jgi:nicotinate dehydrogenase subunit A
MPSASQLVYADTYITINDQRHILQVDGNMPLLTILREHLHLKGTRYGCGSNQCGACFVLVDGVAVASCDTPLWAVAGKTVTTVEGLGTPEQPHRLQEEFLEGQAAQCGYCTSGILISAAALLLQNPHPTEADIHQALDRNLCRCGTHNRVVEAILRATGQPVSRTS